MSNALRTTVNSLSFCTRAWTRTWNRGFSTTTPVSLAFEKKSLNKKITIPKDPYLLSEKVVKFAKKGKLEDAITLVLESPKSRQNEVVWNHLIQESSKLGKTNQSWQLLNDMKKRGFKPSDRTFTILLNSLAINPASPNSVSRALALYQQIKEDDEMSPTLTHTNALLKVCARKQDYETLQSIYKEMPKFGPNSPDVITFNIMINSFARMGGDKGFEMAWKVWKDCIDAKIKRPDEVDLDHALVDAILLACREAKSLTYVKRGCRIVESLYGLSLSSAGGEDGKNSGSLATTTQSVSDSAISPGQALGVGALFKNDTIKPRTAELLLSICIKLKDNNKAQRYMDLIRTTYPDFKPDSQLLSSQMHFQVSIKEYERAIQSWDEIKTLGLQHTPATFKQGLDAAYKARNWDKTWEMYTEMRRLIKKNKSVDISQRRPLNPLVLQQDAWTLVSALKCAVKTKHIPEALQILRESNWTRVVQNYRYPRANFDVAEVAVKIFTTALKKSQTPPSLPSDDSEKFQDTQQQAVVDTTGLELELQRAKEIHLKLTNVLTKFDESKALKEAEEEEALKSQRTQSSSMSGTSSIGEDKEVGGWRTSRNDETTNEYRSPSSNRYKETSSYRSSSSSISDKTGYRSANSTISGKSGWDRLDSSISEKRSSYTPKKAGFSRLNSDKTSSRRLGSSTSGRTSLGKSDFSTPRKTSYEKFGASTSEESHRPRDSGRFEDAFKVSKSFSRDVY
ncbi:hypothetical protein BGZ49_010751 [Haplosporangium sp. Z 27]|nr:hypothetical protein BGZ49_010751 [Haplosporangium sp. Z 27]